MRRPRSDRQRRLAQRAPGRARESESSASAPTSPPGAAENATPAAAPTGGRDSSRRLLALGSCLIPMLLVVVGLCAGTLADFAQWDNLEIYLPWILSAHRRLLHGDLPLWNQAQNLGEPLHAMGPGGVFYVPYTLCTVLVDLLRWNPRALMSVIAVTHVGFAGLGFHRLARSFGVRPLFAMVAGVSGAMSGFGLIVGGVWIHVLPILAWSVWVLWAAKELIDDHRPVRAALVATLSLAMAFAVGHIQAAVYLWVVSALFAIAYAISRRALRARLPVLLAVAVAAALLAMPCVLPSAALLPDSDRTASLTRQDFGYRGVSAAALLGLLLPSFGGMDGFLEVGTLSTTHAGAWLAPALIAACGVWLFGRRLRDPKSPKTQAVRGDAELLPGFGLHLVLAVAIIALSLGDSSPVYGWTYGIPVWSSFRWPFKLFQHALPMLVTAGAIALELATRRAPRGSRQFWFVALALAIAVAWMARPGLATPSAVATGVLGLMAIACLAWLDARWGRAALAVLVVLEAGGLMFLTHRMDRAKTYAHERVGSFGPKELGITTDYRLLPLSPAIPEDAAMQELGLFHSATLDGYYSLTGHRMALTSRRLYDWLPTNALGLLPRQVVPLLLQSHLIRTYNTRYVLAARNDTAMVGFLGQLPGYGVVGGTPGAVVFANQDALPRFYFATEVQPFSVEEARRSLVDNQRPLTAALVTDSPRRGPVPVGRVERSSWGQERVSAEVLAPTGGFLVVSMSYSPDWVARVDGHPARVWLTNGAISGVEIPPGSRRVVLDYEPGSLRRGSWLALLGAAVLATTLFLLSRRERQRRAVAA